MPPRGLTRDRVVDVAAALADREGLDAVTLSAVAAEVGVRTPSLYNHVDGLGGLRRDLALRGVEELGEAMRRAAVGRAGRDAVRSLADAYRAYARAHPGLYAATVAAPDPDDTELGLAADDVVGVVAATLHAHHLQDDELIHAIRALRACLHGFVTIELGSGFGLDVDVDASFGWAVDRLVDGIAGRPMPD